MSENPEYVVAQEVVTFELISNEAAVSLRWYAGKQRYEALFPPQTTIKFHGRTIFADQDRLHEPEAVE
jgi:hypothetical protein